MKLRNSQAKSQRNGHLQGRYLARRLEILRAAGREFRVRGFAETGMRDIAEAAALSPANLYNYFRGKHDILFFCRYDPDLRAAPPAVSYKVRKRHQFLRRSA